MYKKINLDEKKGVKIPVYNGIIISKGEEESNQEECIIKEKEYNSSIYTDGNVADVERKMIARGSQDIMLLPQIEQEKVRFLFNEYPDINEVEITYVSLKNPSFYITMSISSKNGKHGRIRGKMLILEELQEYAVRPVSIDTKRKIQKTYEDIRDLVVNQDASILRYFIGNPQMFRLKYEEVQEDIYQLKKGNVK